MESELNVKYTEVIKEKEKEMKKLAESMKEL